MSNRRRPAKNEKKAAPGTEWRAERKPELQPEPQPASRQSRRFVGIALLAILGPVLALAAGMYIYLTGGRFVSTDNAYVKSDKIAISADISGRVTEVSVHENQLVRAGDLLFRIDTEPFRIALQQAEAKLNSARQEIDALRAQRLQKRAAMQLAQGDVAFYERQFERQKNLNAKGFSSETNLDTASKNLRSARDQVNMLEQDLAQVLARLGGDVDIPTASHPSVREAQAVRDQAALDLRRTEIHAPVAGIVTNFDLQRGEHIEAGDAVFSLVGAGDVWVAANFKETDLTYVRVGQPATIQVDAYPDIVHKAVVSSISPATGAEFALLPPQNATGNWVKVVQRLAVKLTLTNRPEDPPLRAGMSAVVEIDTGHERHLPGLAGSALRWLGSLI